MGSNFRDNWTLRRTSVEVFRGTGRPSPPQDRGAQFNTHAADAAPIENMRSKTSRLMKVCEKPFVEDHDATKRREGVSPAVNRDFGGMRGVTDPYGAPDEARAVCPRRGEGRVLTARERGRLQLRQPKPRDCKQPARQKSRFKNSERGPMQARARPKGRRGAEKIS